MKNEVYCPFCDRDARHTLLDMKWVCDTCGEINAEYDPELDGPIEEGPVKEASDEL